LRTTATRIPGRSASATVRISEPAGIKQVKSN
jgi:hypothetical protein